MVGTVEGAVVQLLLSLQGLHLLCATAAPAAVTKPDGSKEDGGGGDGEEEEDEAPVESLTAAHAHLKKLTSAARAARVGESVAQVLHPPPNSSPNPSPKHSHFTFAFTRTPSP